MHVLYRQMTPQALGNRTCLLQLPSLTCAALTGLLSNGKRHCRCSHRAHGCATATNHLHGGYDLCSPSWAKLVIVVLQLHYALLRCIGVQLVWQPAGTEKQHTQVQVESLRVAFHAKDKHILTQPNSVDGYVCGCCTLANSTHMLEAPGHAQCSTPPAVSSSGDTPHKCAKEAYQCTLNSARSPNCLRAFSRRRLPM